MISQATDERPPTYESAAADQAPPYWETTIIGGPGSLHPLAPGGLGWTPGSPVAGALEDLILEGLPLGNFFGLAWNLLISMTFQFVGFLLTYLLYTTHAAKCGSRAGLGVTLIQYGYYLRTAANRRAAHHSHAEDLADDDSVPDEQQRKRLAAGNFLSVTLMFLGWLILLTSVFSYLRLYRWGSQLVAAAQREQANNATEGDQEQTEASAETVAVPPFSSRLRAFLGTGVLAGSAASAGAAGSRPHDAEDWVIFPGAGRRLTDLEEGHPDEQHEHQQEQQDEHLSPEEARLLANLRTTGFI